MIIGKKIIGGYVFVITLLLISAATGYYSFSVVSERYSHFIDVDEESIQRASNLRLYLEEEKGDYRGYLAYSDDSKTYLDDLQQNRRDFDESLLNTQQSDLSDNDEMGQNILKDIARLHTEFVQIQENIILLVNQGNRPGAINVSLNEIRPVRLELINKIDSYMDYKNKKIQQSRADLNDLQKRLSLFMIIISAIAIIMGFGIGFSITRSINSQLRDAINQISSSSAEILATTSQLASGASETAIAVSETTATSEEVKQTSQISSEKARSVAESAHKAASVSQEGKTAVSQNIEAIKRIKEQTEMVAESIVKLSEQTRAIGEITLTVNDLAEQSNLLAVNAAIEAAKAGEHGKGFTVVANEIRSLAEQSKQATIQVRKLLNDIQRTASATVMATDQVTKAVDSGVKQAISAGESINKLADTISESSQAATQVSVSSQQQFVGINQIGSAMENIKQATQQNAAGIKQAEKAAQNLNELGRELRTLVEETDQGHT